ncbi:helix-turn-helix domain-containing protein [Burkholderia cenocepacia]|uniref:helix-turn-helix domain-containing protein n=1 Tax=Burkholderia cenocepacia TaxID=95486 RepID=UPI002ABDD952|nr:helix-turn-helix domain-containing protein [Burkholderia cenocepacia]
MPHSTRKSKIEPNQRAGRELALCIELLDLLADRLADRLAGSMAEKLRELYPVPAAASRPQAWTTPILPQAPEVRVGALYTIRYVMQRLSVSRGTVYRIARRGDLELVKIGRISRVTGESLRALIERGHTMGQAC